MVKNRSTLWYIALLVGWAFDILYWGRNAVFPLSDIVLILGALAS